MEQGQRRNWRDALKQQESQLQSNMSQMSISNQPFGFPTQTQSGFGQPVTTQQPRRDWRTAIQNTQQGFQQQQFSQTQTLSQSGFQQQSSFTGFGQRAQIPQTSQINLNVEKGPQRLDQLYRSNIPSYTSNFPEFGEDDNPIVKELKERASQEGPNLIQGVIGKVSTEQLTPIIPVLGQPVTISVAATHKPNYPSRYETRKPVTRQGPPEEIHTKDDLTSTSLYT